MLRSALVEHDVLLSAHLFELLLLLVHLLLLGFHHFALRFLPRSVFAHEAQTAVHLGEALRREDEHEAVLHGVLSRYVAHRLHVLRLALLQLLLQCGELGVEQSDVAVEVRDVALYAVDVLLVTVDFAVEYKQVVEALLHVGSVGAQSRLLLLYLLLYARTLALQSAYLGCRVLCVVLLCCAPLLALRSCGLLLRSGLLFCSGCCLALRGVFLRSGGALLLLCVGTGSHVGRGCDEECGD